MDTSSRLGHFIAGALLLGTAALTPSAHAFVVYSGTLNAVIPNNQIGLFVNVVDGSTYVGPEAYPPLDGPGANSDFRLWMLPDGIWRAQGAGYPGQTTPVAPYQTGLVAINPLADMLNLPPGTLIDNSRLFNQGPPSAAPITTGVEAVFGFRLRNEHDLGTLADDTVHFGWARVILVNGQPGILVDYAYESVPLAGITTPVPEPGSAMLLAVGLGVVGLRARAWPPRSTR